MNCQQFETIAPEIAGERILEASAREAGLEHAAACETCTARLADERALTFYMRSMAASTARLEAPPRVEAALLEAFRSGGRENAPARRRVTAQHLRIAAAAAVFVLAASAFAGYLVRGPGSTTPTPEEISKAVPPSKPAPTPKNDAAPAPTPNGPESPLLYSTPDVRTPVSDTPSRRPRAQRPTVRTVSDRAPIQQDTVSELATPFYALAAGGDMALAEGGQIVRVEVPRASLASLGFPVNGARANERVTADILLGNDGMARAIRFVQPQPHGRE